MGIGCSDVKHDEGGSGSAFLNGQYATQDDNFNF